VANQNEFFSGAQGSVWVQPDGRPNTKPEYLMCADLADLVKPRGEVNRTYCVNPDTGEYMIATRLRQPGDPPSTTITVPFGPLQHWLEGVRDCPVPIYINQTLCGQINSFLNADRCHVLPWAMIGQQTDAGLVVRQSNEEGTSAFEIESDWALICYKLKDYRQTTAEDQLALDVFFYNIRHCLGPCGIGEEAGNRGIIACACDTGVAVANVLHTENGGDTWGTIPGPFVNTCDNVSCTAFPMGPGVTRWVITRSTLAGTALQIAYSDDAGVSWTVVDVGATLTEAAAKGGSLFALDAQHMWVCADSGAAGTGNIYFSGDGGLTWAAQAPPSTDALNQIKFVDELTGICVGDTDEVLLTVDGGTSWALAAVQGAVSGANILACAILDANRFWITYSDGTLYYTNDGGAVWTQREFTVPEGGTVEAINDIKFLNDYVGAFVLEWDDAGAGERSTLYVTRDGGYSWLPYTQAADFTASGWLALAMIDPNKVFAVGDLIGATTAINKYKLIEAE